MIISMAGIAGMFHLKRNTFSERKGETKWEA
jgi:hypothetical protein